MEKSESSSRQHHFYLFNFLICEIFRLYDFVVVVVFVVEVELNIYRNNNLLN